MRFISFIILLFISSIVTAQEVEFKASAPSVVETGEQFRLAYSINKEGSNLNVPTLDGFELLMGPSPSQSVSVYSINGKTTQSMTFTYTYLLIGEKEGTYQIPPATIVVDGKQYKSNGLKIQVVKGRGANPSGGNQQAPPNPSAPINEENLFVRVDVNRSNLFMGESLVATIKVYSKVDLANFGRIKYPSFEGFLSEDIPGADRIELVRESYNGQVYNVGIIRKYLLYPQHTGEITIEPFELECIVRQRTTNSRSFMDGFFENYRESRVMKKSRPVTIQVRDLPAGKPLGFSGTVGDITMSTSVSTDTVSANDALTYKVIFSGTGNLRLLRAPSINFPHDFEVYDPKETRDIKTGENGMYGTVTFEYLAIPRYSGEYQIPALDFSFFNSRTNTYKALTGQSYNIHVRKGTEKGNGTESSAIQSFKKEDVRMVGEDVRYIKTGDLKLHDKGVRFFGTPEYWLAFIIPFVFFVVGALLNRRRIAANADLVRVKNKAANKMARRRMKLAAGAMKTHNAELFYDEVLKSLWGYVSYKLNIDRAELNRDNISDLLQKKAVEGAMIQEFISVLDTCEYARYAPGSNSEQEMGKVYQDSIAVITRLDKAIKG